MSDPDAAKLIKDAYLGWLADAYPACTAVLEGEVDYDPRTTPNEQQLLVADDGGPRLLATAWAPRQTPAQPLIRVTVFARGRTVAREIADRAADWILANRPAGIARIKNVSGLLITKDRATGAYLASFTMPAMVRTVPA